MNRYETPSAVKHDVATIADEAHAALEATNEVVDEKVTEARARLKAALEQIRETYGDMKDRAKVGVKQTDAIIRSHPYESLAVACGVGALIGLLIARRN